MINYVQRPNSGLFDCIINDEFILDLKDARLHRRILYKSKSKEKIPINIQSKEFSFPYHCTDFILKLNGEDINDDDVDKNGTFVKNIKVNHSIINLSSEEELLIEIICTWENFYTFLPKLFFAFTYCDVAKYKLKISNLSLKNVFHYIKVNGDDAIPNTDYNIQDNLVIFKEAQIIPHKEDYFLELFSLNTPLDLGILDNRKSIKKELFSNYAILLIQHLLSDVVHLINSFSDAGLDKNGLFIVGIPYSTKQPTIRYLRHHGYKSIWNAKEYDESFMKTVNEAIQNAIKYAKGNNKKIIIVEDGGYAVPLVHKKYQNDIKLFIGAVEQTTNGIKLDKALISDDNIKIKFPVINVAESRIKNKIEGPLIGRTVCKNIELIYEKTFRGLTGEKIGVIGYGTIGKNIAKYLLGRGAIVNIYDSDSTTRSEIRENGFAVSDNISELVSNNKIIVESTGKYWTDNSLTMKKIIFSFRNESFFVSASSKRMGIDQNEFVKLIDPKGTMNIPGVGIKYKIRNDDSSNVTFVADGYPVNFFLGESVPDKDIAFIIVWMYKCTEILIQKHEKLLNGIIDTNNKHDKIGFYNEQKEIAALIDLRIS